MFKNKFLQRYVPQRRQFGNNRLLHVFGDRLHDQHLWHLNRHSVSGAIALGLFCAYLPMPMHMLLAALGAIVFRVNLPISVALVWISNPLTWVPIYGPAYLLGAKLLGETPALLQDMTVQRMVHHLAALWLGCLIIGTLVSAVGYMLARALWHLRSAPNALPPRA